MEQELSLVRFVDALMEYLCSEALGGIMIYTTYFAKLRSLPDDVVPIAICAKVPDWFHGLSYKRLAPSYHTLMDYKHFGNQEVFCQEYREQVLSKLDATDVVLDFSRLCPGFNVGENAVALVCYEKATDFCHRHLVAEWLRKNGFDCREWEDV